MNSAEIVVHIVKRDSPEVIINFFGKRIRQSREAAHRHSHSKILALYVARRDVLGIRMPHDGSLAASDALRRAVTGFCEPILAVELNQHRVVDVLAERILDRL